MTPILTNRARRQVPKPGSNTFRASLPRTQPSLFEYIGAKPVAVEQVEESEVPTFEEVLCAIPSHLFLQIVTNTNRAEIFVPPWILLFEATSFRDST